MQYTVRARADKSLPWREIGHPTDVQMALWMVTDARQSCATCEVQVLAGNEIVYPASAARKPVHRETSDQVKQRTG